MNNRDSLEGSNFGIKNALNLETFKGCTTCCCYVRCLTLLEKIMVMPWFQTGANHCHTPIGLSVKSHANIVLVVWP